MGSQRECTRILGLASFRVETVEWEADGSRARIRVWIERRGIRGYECSGCRRRTWRVRDHAERTWDDLPWAEHRVNPRVSATACVLSDVRHSDGAGRLC